jgi:hypothetical protein
MRTQKGKLMKADEVIASVVEVLNGPDTIEAKHLWNVLTALRGPDTDDYALKLNTTSKIRGAIGLKSNSTGAFVSYEALPDSPDSAFALANRGGFHFADHFKMAVESLIAMKGR